MPCLSLHGYGGDALDINFFVFCFFLYYCFSCFLVSTTATMRVSVFWGFTSLVVQVGVGGNLKGIVKLFVSWLIYE